MLQIAFSEKRELGVLLPSDTVHTSKAKETAALLGNNHLDFIAEA